jgi:lambda family phage tail tape measure protein
MNAWQTLNNQQAALTGQNAVTSAQDQQAVAAQTGTGALNQSKNLFVQNAQDTANQVKQIWNTTWSGVNEQLENMLDGQKTSWKSFLGGIAKDFAGIFLQRGESALMSSLFPSSSTSKSGSSGGGITSLFSGIGKLFSGLGFAGGGSPPTGKFSLVGENGPELRYFGSPSTIVPAGGFGGSSTTHNWSIDARGATDPAMVNAAVQRGIAKAMPSITAVTMHAQREHKARGGK